MNASQILDEAKVTLSSRAVEYDQPQGERSMAHCVEIFTAISGIKLSESEGWLFMLALKLAGAQKGEPKADTYLEGAAYFALYGESKLAQQEQIPLLPT